MSKNEKLLNGFKIIGLYFFNSCNSDLIKGLKKNTLYPFYNNYTFVFKKNGEVSSIKPPKEGINLYSNGKQNINISAIVGKNGSGKSSLLEILYLLSLGLSYQQKKIKKELQKIRIKNKNVADQIDFAVKNLHIEVFFQTKRENTIDEYEICSLVYKGGNLNYIVFNPTRKANKTTFNLKQFCYTITLNYSLHGLNELYSPWLSPLFHKNDGYQAPLVINPHRDEGNIDVNIENDLSNQRLIQNLSDSDKDKYQLIANNYVEQIEFSFSPFSVEKLKYETIKKEKEINNIQIDVSLTIKQFEIKHRESFYSFLNVIIRKINSIRSTKIKEINQKQIENFKIIRNKGLNSYLEEIKRNLISTHLTDQDFSNLFEYLLIEYIIKKILKIHLFIEDSIQLNTVLKGEFLEAGFFTISSIQKTKLLNRISSDESHLTLKIRQMLFLKDNLNQLFKNKQIQFGIKYGVNHFSLFTEISLKDLKKYSVILENQNAKGLEKIPTGLFSPSIKLSFPQTNNNALQYLSSGELQLLYSIHTVLYHLRNINSVIKSKDHNNILYPNINIILDEIELCFHPDLQRIFISELLRNIKELDIPFIENINIIFSTHSPFILSDIPSSNILRLKEGNPFNEDKEQTFGANIHNLLANDFFLKDGFMGAFAKEKINDLINYLTFDQNKSIDSNNITPKYLWSEEIADHFIKQVGEPLLKYDLKELFLSKFYSVDAIDKEIERLQRLKVEKSNSKSE